MKQLKSRYIILIVSFILILLLNFYPSSSVSETGANEFTQIINVLDESTDKYPYSSKTIDNVKYDDTKKALILASGISGTYTSQVLDAGVISNWKELSWSEEVTIGCSGTATGCVNSAFDTSAKCNAQIGCNWDIMGCIGQKINCKDLSSTQCGYSNSEGQLGCYWNPVCRTHSLIQCSSDRLQNSNDKCRDLGCDWDSSKSNPCGPSNRWINCNIITDSITCNKWSDFCNWNSNGDPNNPCSGIASACSRLSLTQCGYNANEGQLGCYWSSASSCKNSPGAKVCDDFTQEFCGNQKGCSWGETTNITFQIRACDDADCIGEDFIGPDGETNSYYLLSSNKTLNLEGRYIQYKAYLSASSPQYTPELHGVNFKYISGVEQIELLGEPTQVIPRMVTKNYAIKTFNAPAVLEGYDPEYDCYVDDAYLCNSIAEKTECELTNNTVSPSYTFNIEEAGTHTFVIGEDIDTIAKIGVGDIEIIEPEDFGKTEPYKYKSPSNEPLTELDFPNGRKRIDITLSEDVDLSNKGSFIKYYLYEYDKCKLDLVSSNSFETFTRSNKQFKTYINEPECSKEICTYIGEIVILNNKGFGNVGGALFTFEYLSAVEEVGVCTDYSNSHICDFNDSDRELSMADTNQLSRTGDAQCCCNSGYMPEDMSDPNNFVSVFGDAQKCLAKTVPATVTITSDKTSSVSTYTLTANTNKKAKCRSSTNSSETYITMSDLTTTDLGVEHSFTWTELTNNNYTFYVACMDSDGIETTESIVVEVSLPACTLDKDCDDQNPCTGDICKENFCSNTGDPSLEGTTCNTDKICNSRGTCVECLGDIDCEEGEVCSKEKCKEEQTLCGNDICDLEYGESYLNCIEDCHCGDGTCQEKYFESPDNCPQDCEKSSAFLIVSLVLLFIVGVVLYVAYAKGWLGKFIKVGKKEEVSTEPPVVLAAQHNVNIPSNSTSSLNSYIRDCRARGSSYTQIKKSLLDKGWKEDIINKVFGQMA